MVSLSIVSVHLFPEIQNLYCLVIVEVHGPFLHIHSYLHGSSAKHWIGMTIDFRCCWHRCDKLVWYVGLLILQLIDLQDL
jgi:hypothetical protein